MATVFIAAAFICGVSVSFVGLPPLVGYLIAGFALNALGFDGGAPLQTAADWGVRLLLFTIGLKLDLKSLAAPAVWAGTALHMMLTILIFGAVMTLLAASGVPPFSGLSLSAAGLTAFALSFSSTVFAVKVFEEKNETGSRHAGIAVGMLIMQDVIAVVFLAVSSGKLPSVYAPLLVGGLFIVRPLIMRLLTRCGHGELLMLLGILMTAAGYASFELVDLKGDLGALVFGLLVAGHPKAAELAKGLMSFKDLFLVAFFLNIGMSGLPSWAALGAALFLAVLMPIKIVLFFGLLTRFRLRARTSMLTALSLANYSEFGLIVGAVGVSAGWLNPQWLVIPAVALSITFILAAPLNAKAHALYARFSPRLKPFEHGSRLPEDAPLNAGDATVAVIGLGGIGTAAYDEMRRRRGDKVLGIDFCAKVVEAHRAAGRRAAVGDATDSEFWERVHPVGSPVEQVMLALPDPNAAIFAVQQLKARGYTGGITASVRYADQAAVLRAAGIDEAYIVSEEAGVGFADYVGARLHDDPPAADQGRSS